MSGFTDLRKTAGQLVGQGDGHRHQFRRLVGGIPEHHALVAGSAGIHTHGDVAGLLVDRRNHGTGVGVEAVGGIVIPDGSDDAPHQRLKINICPSTNFSGNHHQPGRGKGFARNPAMRVLFQTGVQNGIGDLVGNLVGMSFCYGLRGK